MNGWMPTTAADIAYWRAVERERLMSHAASVVVNERACKWLLARAMLSDGAITMRAVWYYWNRYQRAVSLLR